MTAPSIQTNFTKYQSFVKWVGGKRQKKFIFLKSGLINLKNYLELSTNWVKQGYKCYI